MKALLLDAPTPPEDLPSALHLAEIDAPEPGPGQVRLHVEALGLNPVDWKVARSGHRAWSWPHVLGLDIAGTIDAFGPYSDRLRSDLAPGMRVALHHDLRAQGGLAEFVIVDALALAPIPDSVSDVSAAALPCAGMTALQALRRLHLSAGEYVFITAGTGGVGGYAIQLAKAAGLHVITSASPDKTEIVRALGADHVIDYRALAGPEDIALAARSFTPDERGVDGVIDTIGPASATANLHALAFQGGLSAVGGRPDLALFPDFGLSPTINEISLGAAYSHGTPRDRHRLAQDLQLLLDDVQAARLDPRVIRVVTLEEAGEAYAEIATGHSAGKIVCQLS